MRTPAVQPQDVRAALLASASESDPEFPDGKNLVLTHFSYIGSLETSEGGTINVADQRGGISGMLAPRGKNYIHFFDDHFRFLGKVGYVASRPLWCDGSRLYLFGNLDGSIPGQTISEGNVIDLADGYARLKCYRVSAYGSYGGIDD